MAAIDISFLPQVNFAPANALLAQGQQTTNKAVDDLVGVFDNYRKQKQAQNTNALVQAINAAGSPEQFNDPTFRAGIQQMQDQFQGEYDAAAITSALDTRPGTLMDRVTKANEFAATDEINAMTGAALRGDADAFISQMGGLGQGVVAPNAAVQALTSALGRKQDQANADRNFQLDTTKLLTGNSLERQRIGIAQQNADTSAAQLGMQNKPEVFMDEDGNQVVVGGGNTPVLTNKDGKLTWTTGSGSAPSNITASQYSDIGSAVEGVRNKFGSRESGNDYNTPNKAGASSAFGRFQFTEDTWKRTLKNTPGYNNLSEQQIMNLRSNPKAQEDAFTTFTSINAKTLQDMGIPLNDGTLYTAHFLGLGEPRNIKAVLSTAGENESIRKYVGADQYAANKSVFDQHSTVGDFRKWVMGAKSGGANKATGTDSPRITRFKMEDVNKITGAYQTEINTIQRDRVIEDSIARSKIDPNKTSTSITYKLNEGFGDLGTKLLTIATETPGWEKRTEAERHDLILAMSDHAKNLAKTDIIPDEWFLPNGKLKAFATNYMHNIDGSKADIDAEKVKFAQAKAVDALILGGYKPEAAYKQLGLTVPTATPQPPVNSASNFDAAVEAERKRKKDAPKINYRKATGNAFTQRGQGS